MPQAEHGSWQMRAPLASLRQRSWTSAATPGGHFRREDTMAILVLEDDDDYAEIIAHTLRRGGHDVVVTNTVSAALNFARHRQPSAAVLDVMLPDGSGLEACMK